MCARGYSDTLVLLGSLADALCGWLHPEAPLYYAGNIKGPSGDVKKALLDLYRSCTGALKSQDLFKGKSRAVAIALPYGRSLLSVPGRSNVNLTED